MRRTTSALAAFVVLVLVAAGATYRFDLGPRWFGLGAPSPLEEPAAVPPPAGLTLPPARTAAPVAPPAADVAADPAAVRRAVDRLAGAPKLGAHVVVRVSSAADGRLVYRRGAGPVIPASTLKLVTTMAALEALGPERRFRTSVVATRGAARVVLVGGGDPLLARRPVAGDYPPQADLETLAASTAAALREAGRTRVRLGYDATLFSGPAVNPRWQPSYVPEDVVSPITALWVDQGRERTGEPERVDRPDLAAARAFARALERRRIDVVGAPVAGAAPTREQGGRTLAQVRSATLAQIVQHVLENSDNEAAEVLARQVAVAQGRPASFAGGVAAVREVLRGVGVSTAGSRLYDGSGLSRDNRLRAETLLAVFREAGGPERPRLRSILTTVPVAGFTGSLASRYEAARQGLGSVRAKTGTLTGVHGLAGTVTSRDGVVMSFVAIADRVEPVDSLDARARLDEIGAALASCVCAAGP